MALKDQILKLWEEEPSLNRREIAERLGTTRSTVAGVIYRHKQGLAGVTHRDKLPENWREDLVTDRNFEEEPARTTLSRLEALHLEMDRILEECGAKRRHF